MLRDGKTQQEVVDELAAEGIPARQSSISRIKLTYGDKHGLVKGGHRTRWIPWELAPEDRGRQDAQMLRLLDREERGEPIPPREQRRLDSWRRRLDEEDASVGYFPHTTERFVWITPRRPGETYVRYPDDEVGEVAG